MGYMYNARGKAEGNKTKEKCIILFILECQYYCDFICLISIPPSLGA